MLGAISRLGPMWCQKRFRYPAVAVVAAIAAASLMGTYSPWTAKIGPGEVRLSAGWQWGGSTTVEIPPLGDITASTHWAPVNVKASLMSVDTDQVQQTVSADNPADVLEDQVRDGLTDALPYFALRTLVIALFIGIICAAVLAPLDRRAVLAGALAAVLVVGALLGTTWRTYDVAAFEQPRYSGSLTQAPRVLAAVRKHVGGLDDARRKLSTLSNQVSDLYKVTDPSNTAQQFDTSILHVSDLHSNPVGFELTRNLATSFGVDAIIDTGDVTSFGLPIETRATELLAGMPAPYYVVFGNHDSPQVREALRATPGVIELDNTVAEVKGIKILGVGDPTFTATNETSTEEANERKRAQAAAVRGQLLANPGTGILAVHSIVQAGEAFGGVPLVIAGHAHEHSIINRDNTTALVVGSTGAGGVGAFTVTAEPQYEAEVLRFEGGVLRAVDYVTLNGAEGDFTVVRSVVPLDSIPPDNKPAEDPTVSTTTSTTTQPRR